MARIFTKENIKLIAFLSINVTIKQSSKKNYIIKSSKLRHLHIKQIFYVNTVRKTLSC